MEAAGIRLYVSVMEKGRRSFGRIAVFIIALPGCGGENLVKFPEPDLNHPLRGFLNLTKMLNLAVQPGEQGREAAGLFRGGLAEDLAEGKPFPAHGFSQPQTFLFQSPEL